MPSYYDQISNSGPKIWYRFNETAGTPVNSGSLATTSTFSNLLLNEQTDVDGRAVYLDGSLIQLPAHSQFALFNDRSFTVEVWVRILNADTNRTSPLEIFRLNAPSGPHYAVSLTVDGTAGTRGKVRLGSPWTTDILSTNAIDDNAWHHIVYTYNTSSVKLYIDGTLNASTTPTNLIAAFNFDQSTKKLIGAGYVGTAQTSISQYFKGRMDEFAAYDYELTAQNILANFDAGASVGVTAEVIGTATALMVNSTVSASFNPAAQAPMTASAVLANVEVSNFDDVNGIQKIISDLGPEIWLKFDYVTDYTTTTPFYMNINYGSGGTISSSGGIYPDFKQVGPAQEPSIELQIGATQTDFLTYTTAALFTTEISDNNFSIGMWFKMPTGIDTSEKQIFAYNGPTNSPLSFKINNKKAVFALQTSHTTYTHTETNDISENVWHLAVIKLDLAATTLKYYLDGTEVFSNTAIQGNRATPTSFNIGKQTTNGTDTGNKRMFLSHFFVDGYSDVTPTVITNLWNAGTRQNQAKGVMRQPIIRFQNAYDDYVTTLNPLAKLGFNETTGTILENTGFNTNNSHTLLGTNFTRGTSVPTKNRYGYNFTNKNTFVSGNYGTATNSYADNTQTVSVYAKINTVTGSDLQTIFIYGAGGGATGIGLSLMANAGGPTLYIIPTTNPATWSTISSGTQYFGDYHLYTLKRDGTSVKFYIDGKQVGSTLTYSAYNFTDSGSFAIGGGETVWLGAGATTTNKFIDEFAAFDYALTDQQIFDMWQSIETDRFAASSLFVDPTIGAGFGPTVSATPMTASGFLPMPTEVQEIVPTIVPMNAHGVFQHPNFQANAVIDVNYGTEPLAANAIFHPAGFNIGEIHAATDMEATALMVHPISIAGGSISVNPGVALNATFVMPALVTTLGALIKPQTLNANAFAPLPPAYFTIADDLWYQRLVAIDQKDSVGNSSIVFFNTSDNFYVPSIGAVDPIPGSGWTVRAPLGARATNTVTSPLPAINGGYFDGQNRKAVNFRNIEISTGAPGTIGVGDRDFTFEAMIRTTKSNQVLFVGENDNGNNFQRTGIILRDGKLALTYSKDARAGAVSANDEYLAFTGFKNIADGQWHHIIIQNRQTGVDGSGARLQFWIDGQLDIQRYGNEMYVFNRIGYNSPELNSYSDFTISAFGLGLSAMVEENEITLNYLAAFNIIPVKAPVATASATATPNTKGRGNRGRALMLYFWPTQNYATGIYGAAAARAPFQPFGNNFHSFDQGGYGNDPDTFYQLSTYTTNGANKFYDWDLWPVSVTGLTMGDTWVGESHPILKDDIFKTGTDKGTVYVNPITDNERYLNLMTDFKDLDQFDMICFRNYPDQSNEQDQYGINAKGVADAYFNLLDKDLFDVFLKSLRDAVDTGISLLITNPQLAVDMGFIDTYHTVPDLTNAGNDGLSDPFAPVKLNDPYGDGSEIYNINYPTSLTNADEGNEYRDSYRNNYHQVANTLYDLTDDAAFIWTDWINYDVDGSEFGELDRWWSHIEYNEGLQVGDKFLISTTKSENQEYFAAPISAVRAGKVITKFADTYYFGASERVNPYRDYATSIAVEPGTVVAGKQIGAKVFISFTDLPGIQQGYARSIGDGLGRSIEQQAVLLNSPYWISYAYSTGAISASERDLYLQGAQPVNWENLTSTDTPYWTLDGSEISGTLTQFGDDTQVTADTAESVRTGKTPGRTRRGKRKTVASTGFLPNFSITWGWGSQTFSINVPSINTRGLWWLSERLEYGDDIPKRPEHFFADAFMKQPVITGFKTVNVAAQAAVAVAALPETNLRSADVVRAVLPLTATALFAERARIIAADVSTASALTPQDIRITTVDTDQIILYIVHVDPILYLREEVIK